MKKLVRLGLLVGAIAMSPFATVQPTHAAAPDCSTVYSQTCTTQGSTMYCRFYDDYPDCQFKCTCDPSFGWRCGPDPNFGICI
jgi:hypothetical protein